MNKKEKCKQLKNKNGITLITLVVTIIVLIILAAVSISLMLGENGIITKSRDAARRTEEARLNEEVATNELMEQWDSLLVGVNTPIEGGNTPIEGITASDIEADASYIGKYVNYGGQETFKGVKWRIFNVENGQIQLIADNYIKSDVMPEATNIRRGTAEYSSMKSDFCVNSSDNRITLLNYINTTSNWSDFVAVEGATVTGSPTIEQFVNSYNRTHGANSESSLKEIFIAKSEVMADGLQGYYVGSSENPTGTSVSPIIPTEMEGLYSIIDTINASAYWLGSPCATYYGNIKCVLVGALALSGSGTNSYGLRPLVSLPSGTILVEEENGTYSLPGQRINPETPIEVKTVEEMKTAQTYMIAKTTLKDSNGNKVVIPEGFKIAEDSGLNVTEGIVIEDKDIIEGVGNNRGNQYVWIPVGKKIKKQNEDGTISEVEIVLGRYVFADGSSHKNEKGIIIRTGTPILKQSAENYKQIVTVEQQYQEVTTAREGIETSDRTSLNTTALDLKGFIDSVKANGGYYIARYEASYGIDGKANSKVSNNFNDSSVQIEPTEEGYLWNNITQIDAAIASRGIYEKVTTDLTNSYAWDTAILYIQTFAQTFSGDKYYSRKKAKMNPLSNTGETGDEVCKINDMASNTTEWTTEDSLRRSSYTAYSCTIRGGRSYSSDDRTSDRSNSFGSSTYYYTAFRTILYI